MPLGRRHRYALALCLAAAGAVAGTVLAAPDRAMGETRPTVTFNGGCGVRGAGAASEPDADSLAVPAEGAAIFVNHLGQNATLLVDDRAAGSLRANDEVAVVFHRGPVSVKLAPACLPAARAVAISVRVGHPAARRGAGGYPGATRTAPGAGQSPPVPEAHSAPGHRAASKILFLVAVICVVGMSVATIRAIITQRAIRTARA
jgi:hypothetical protein